MKRPICRRMSLMALSKLEFVASFRIKNGYISVYCIYKLTRIAHLYFKCIEKFPMSSFLYLAIQRNIKLFIFPSPSESELCVTQILYIFIPKMHLEKHNTKALHHLILTAYGKQKIEYSLVSNIYSTPILFFSKWV